MDHLNNNLSQVILLAALFNILTMSLAWAEPTHTPFNHRIHEQHWPKGQSFRRNCSSCHPNGRQGDTVRPGQTDHSSCDNCHKEAFYNTSTPNDTPSRQQVCTVCHESDAYGKPNPLHSFPYMSREEQRSGRDTSRDKKDFYVTMSHKNHVRYYSRGIARPKERCNSCHKIQNTIKPVSMPTHKNCSHCHQDNPKDSPKSTFAMSECGQCHKFQFRDTSNKIRVKNAPVPRHRKGRVKGRFSHWNHRYERLEKRPKKKVSCELCHEHVKRADTLKAVVPIENGRRTMTDACGTCHRRNMISASGNPLVRITGDCRVCHTAGSLLGSDIPQSHMRAP